MRRFYTSLVPACLQTSTKMQIIFLLFTLALFAIGASTTIFPNTNLNPLHANLNEAQFPQLGGNWRRRCPVCDASVYSYCTDKLFHDSCCCHDPNNPYDRYPIQCQLADCSFLHANTCSVHKLITACCCTNLLYQRK